ncbi:MAG: hypothetical protein EBZ48_04775, partial [Proteobacteria bacterium]|nr:hypothetical protein [Pseudomonadota bacterium]
LLYRHERTGFIWLAVASALVMLYSHLSGSTVIALTAVACALIDLRYHLCKLPLGDLFFPAHSLAPSEKIWHRHARAIFQRIILV